MAAISSSPPKVIVTLSTYWGSAPSTATWMQVDAEFVKPSRKNPPLAAVPPWGPFVQNSAEPIQAPSQLYWLSLLKIQFGASEGRYKQHRATSPILRSSTLIAMMQAANLREGNNVIACEG